MPGALFHPPRRLLGDADSLQCSAGVRDERPDTAYRIHSPLSPGRWRRAGVEAEGRARHGVPASWPYPCFQHCEAFEGPPVFLKKAVTLGALITCGVETTQEVAFCSPRCARGFLQETFAPNMEQQMEFVARQEHALIERGALPESARGAVAGPRRMLAMFGGPASTAEYLNGQSTTGEGIVVLPDAYVGETLLRVTPAAQPASAEDYAEVPADAPVGHEAAAPMLRLPSAPFAPSTPPPSGERAAVPVAAAAASASASAPFGAPEPESQTQGDSDNDEDTEAPQHVPEPAPARPKPGAAPGGTSVSFRAPVPVAATGATASFDRTPFNYAKKRRVNPDAPKRVRKPRSESERRATGRPRRADAAIQTLPTLPLNRLLEQQRHDGTSGVRAGA